MCLIHRQIGQDYRMRYHFLSSGSYGRITRNPCPYEGWTRESLIARLTEVETGKAERPSKPPQRGKPFVFSSYPRRKIALKFCYSGWAYNGFQFQDERTPLPTVEGVLFNCLSAARLVDPAAGFEGCGWERAGRTDVAVSAAGQVVSLWVRSRLKSSDNTTDCRVEDLSSDSPGASGSAESNITRMPQTQDSVLRSESEHPFVTILNRLLPPTLRVLAWSPVAPTFSARFQCQSRHYRYIFSPRDLDTALMNDAASRLVGDHDFRNLCKVPPSKQKTSFIRSISRADIRPLANSRFFCLDIVGKAFLYHQVRHIMAVLFLVGAGLEHPSVVSSLLNVEERAVHRRDGDPELEVVTSKPHYQMADPLPLVFYEASYSPEDINWQTSTNLDPAFGDAKLYNQLDSMVERSDLYASINNQFLEAASVHHRAPLRHFPLNETSFALDGSKTMNIPLGGQTYNRTSTYVPLLARSRQDHFEVQNERWRTGKGFRRQQRKSNLSA